MTTREIYTAVINADLSEEITDYFTDALSRLDKRNADAKIKREKETNAEVQAFFAKVKPMFKKKEYLTCAEMYKGYPDSTQKRTTFLRQLVKSGVLCSRLTDRTGKPCKEYFINPDKAD